MSTIRKNIHEIVNQQNVVATTADDVALAFKKFQENPNQLEMKAKIEQGLKAIRDAAFKANALVQEIKFPTYSLTDPDIDIEDLYTKLREKNREIMVHVIDDEKLQNTLYKSILDKAGFLSSYSQNYEDALKYIVTELPQIVILNLHIPKSEGVMGEMFGHEVIEVIKKESDGIQVIVVMADDDPRIIEHISKYKPVRILTKPVTVASVEAALSVAVAKIAR